jgi:hypothetical protein
MDRVDRGQCAIKVPAGVGGNMARPVVGAPQGGAAAATAGTRAIRRPGRPGARLAPRRCCAARVTFSTSRERKRARTPG